MKIQNFVSAIFMAAMLSTMLPLAQAKEKINVSELPDRIVKITMKIFPDATISRAKIVDDHGEYDVYGEFPDSRKFKIDFNDWEKRLLGKGFVRFFEICVS